MGRRYSILQGASEAKVQEELMPVSYAAVVCAVTCLVCGDKLLTIHLGWDHLISL